MNLYLNNKMNNDNVGLNYLTLNENILKEGINLYFKLLLIIIIHNMILKYM